MTELWSRGPSGPPPQWRYQPPPSRIAAIQRNFSGYHRYWTPGWYTRYPVAWNPYWITPYRWWYRPTWSHTWSWLAGHLLLDILDPPVYYPYYYGTNVIYRDHVIYINDDVYVTADEFYGQAWDLAHSTDMTAPSSESEDDWLPLGTFSIFEDGGEKETGLVIQLAADKDGHVFGNIFDEANDTVWPVAGAVEMATQRVALRLDDDEELVYECGLWNLTQDTVPMLVHVGAEEQTNWTLIRLVSSEEQQSVPTTVYGGGSTRSVQQQSSPYRTLRRETLRRNIR